MSLRDRYEEDIDSLLARGREMVEAVLANKSKAEYGYKVTDTPLFHDGYQAWYSEARALIQQVLPARLDDFVEHYSPNEEKNPQGIEDLLLGRTPYVDAAINRLRQQVAIVEAAKGRFDRSLYEIRQLELANLFDSELDAAVELKKKGFLRSSGVLAGVVLEGHLRDVCEQRGIQVAKKRPNIAYLANLLRKGDVLDLPQSRNIQHLADLRNLCSHKRDKAPSCDDVETLLDGVNKVLKTVF